MSSLSKVKWMYTDVWGSGPLLLNWGTGWERSAPQLKCTAGETETRTSVVLPLDPDESSDEDSHSGSGCSSYSRDRNVSVFTERWCERRL